MCVSRKLTTSILLLRGFQKAAVQCPSNGPVQCHWCLWTSRLIGLDQCKSKMTTLSIRKRLHAADCCMTSWEWEQADILGILCWVYLWCMAEIWPQSSQVHWRVWAKRIHLYSTWNLVLKYNKEKRLTCFSFTLHIPSLILTRRQCVSDVFNQTTWKVRVGREPGFALTHTLNRWGPSHQLSRDVWTRGRPAERVSAETKACCLFDESLNSPSTAGMTALQKETRSRRGVDEKQTADEKEFWTFIQLNHKYKDIHPVQDVTFKRCLIISTFVMWMFYSKVMQLRSKMCCSSHRREVCVCVNWGVQFYNRCVFLTDWKNFSFPPAAFSLRQQYCSIWYRKSDVLYWNNKHLHNKLTKQIQAWGRRAVTRPDAWCQGEWREADLQKSDSWRRLVRFQCLCEESTFCGQNYLEHEETKH